MKKFAICLALGMTLAPTAGSAQVMIDTTRISCEQYVAMAPADSDMISAWMSGWFNQKAGYTWVDLNAYHRNIVNIKTYCAAHPKDVLMGVLQEAALKMQQKH